MFTNHLRYVSMTLTLSFPHLMNQNDHIPPYVIDEYQKIQRELGGEFKRYPHLNPRIFKAVVYSVQKQEGNEVTRLLLLQPAAFILYHEHLEGRDNTTFQMHVLNSAYGHVLLHHDRRLPLQDFIIQRGESYGISVLSGFVILQIQFTAQQEE